MLNFNEEEFIYECLRKKGDLTNLEYTVYENVTIKGDFPYGIKLGKGYFKGRFTVEPWTYMRSLDFDRAKFEICPEISEKIEILIYYNDQGYFANMNNEELSQAGLLIPTNRLEKRGHSFKKTPFGFPEWCFSLAFSQKIKILASKEKTKSKVCFQSSFTFRFRLHKPMNYKLKKISGIDCLFAPMTEGNSITIDISIKAGSIYEKPEEAGISHFLEHMFFKGGKKRKTPQEVAIAMDKIGAYFNASTGKEATSYYVKCAPQFALNGLEMLADMLMDATFQPEELEREKGVVIQELKMYEDNPQQLLWKKRSTFFLGDNPYGKPIIGYEDTINSFNREMLFAYKKELYTKDNLLITITGNITDQAELENQIAILFGSLPEQKTRQKPDFQRSLPTQHSDSFTKNTEQNRILITIPGFTLKDEKLLSAASLLCTMLGGNMSSRLFQNIREKAGLCYSIHAGHASYQNYGYFYITAGLDKNKFTQGVEMIHQEIDQFITDGFSDEELENAKTFKTGSLQMGIESSDEMADFLGTQLLLEGKIETIQDIIDQYQAVSREDIQALFPHLSKDQRRSYHIE